MEAEAVRVTVRPAEVLAPDPAAKLGLNLNAYTDGELAERDFHGLVAALRRMGVRWLRYPGGEKSDGLWWAPPPFVRPEPTLIRPDVWPGIDPGQVHPDGRWVRPVLGFDRFVALCRAVGAEPVVVVAYDALYPKLPAGGDADAPTRDELIAAAAAWVRYANVERGYGVRYWEVGNESYSVAYNGGASAGDYARDFSRFAEGMKRVDPSIRVGANGPNRHDGVAERDRDAGNQRRWWPHVLSNTGDAADFIAVHHYPGWGWDGVEGYRRWFRKLDDVAREAERAAAGRDLPALVTEYHVHDWSEGGWPGRNDMGHAVALAEGLGRLLRYERVAAVLVWNTRWVDRDRPDPLFDVYDADLRLRLSGRVLELWSRLATGPMVAAGVTPVADGAEGDAGVAAFAFRSARDNALDVLLVNRGATARRVELQTPGEAWAIGGGQTLTADRPEATAAAWRPATTTADGRIELPGLSLTHVRLIGRSAGPEAPDEAAPDRR